MLNFLLSIADGDNREKVQYLYDRFHDDMLRFAKYRLRLCDAPNVDEVAQDVVQSAFLKLTKYIHSVDFTLSEGELKSYVLAVVANEVMNFVSKNETIDELQGDMPDEDFFARIRIEERYREVTDAVQKLDEKYSHTMLLHYWNHLEVKQIADMMGLAEKSVYTRLERGRRLLLELLEGGKKDGAE